MRRYFLYFAVALLTFGIGVFVAFKFYWSNEQAPKVEETIATETVIQKEASIEDDRNKGRPSPQCVRADPDDTQPWVHESKVIDSFPPDDPKPRYLGAFRDKDWDYQLILFQDAKGVFGELLSPVLDADSPTSVIRDATFDSRSGTLKFSARVPGEELQFNGILSGRRINATITGFYPAEKIILKRIKWHDDEYPEGWYKSRAEFDCAMFLYRRD